ncbi:MAG: class I SAM-dependent methyltransferase [Candidatus Aminicenantes bacterium]|nr:class I SAM-dependent methyltransferase [Candidatus Aminicenantes bacterium]
MAARRVLITAWGLALALAAAPAVPAPQAARGGPELDRRVEAFLESRSGTWRDMNVPEADGRTLHDLIVSKGYTKALEIGTSTGHSGVWIAWALSKTGGRLVTVDIDEGRHREAVANFEAAGLAPWIDARLADAHELVPALPGPFDFVFCDADKDWYKNYFDAVLPKLAVGGSFVAHNVSERMRRGGWGAAGFVVHVLALPFMETTFVGGSWSGMSVSVKKAAR